MGRLKPTCIAATQDGTQLYAIASGYDTSIQFGEPGSSTRYILLKSDTRPTSLAATTWTVVSSYNLQDLNQLSGGNGLNTVSCAVSPTGVFTILDAYSIPKDLPPSAGGTSLPMNPQGVRYDPSLDTNKDVDGASGPGGWVNVDVKFNWPLNSLKSMLFYISSSSPSKLTIGVLDNSKKIWFGQEDDQGIVQPAGELPCPNTVIDSFMSFTYNPVSNMFYVVGGLSTSLTTTLLGMPMPADAKLVTIPANAVAGLKTYVYQRPPTTGYPSGCQVAFPVLATIHKDVYYMLCVNPASTGDTSAWSSQLYTVPSLSSSTSLSNPTNVSSDFKTAVFDNFFAVDGGVGGVYAVLHDPSKTHSSLVLDGPQTGSYWMAPPYYANVTSSFDDIPENNGVIRGGNGGGGGGSGERLSPGAIVGIVFGIWVAVAALLWWCRRGIRDIEEEKGGDGLFEEHKGEYLDPNDPDVIKTYQNLLQNDLQLGRHPGPAYSTTIGESSNHDTYGRDGDSVISVGEKKRSEAYSTMEQHNDIEASSSPSFSPQPVMLSARAPQTVPQRSMNPQYRGKRISKKLNATPHFTMDKAVFQTIADALSSDFNTRMRAELRLKELQHNPEYPLSLVKLTLARECNISQRHSAAAQLKIFVDLQWSTKNCRFLGPEPPEETHVISKIANLDWPDNWSHLLDELLQYLKTGTGDQVHGSTKVLAELISKEVSHVQLPFVVPVLFPELLRIMSSEQIYSHATRSKCVVIFKNVFEMMFTIKGEYPNVLKLYLEPAIGHWTEAFISILNRRTTYSPEIEVAEWRLKSEVLGFFNMAVPAAPKLMNAYILPVLSAVWQDLTQMRPRYIQQYVNTSSDITGGSYQDSDGNNIGIESLLFNQFDFLHVACRRSKLTQDAFIGKDGQSGIVTELVWNIIQFMQVTDEQVETWNSDPNQFIADEEEDSYSYNVRIATKDLLVTLAENYEPQTLNALNLGIQQYVSGSMAEKEKGSRHWWKPQESSLLSVGLFSGELCNIIQLGEVSPIDVVSLFHHVVLANMSEHSFPFLQGRSFVFASQFASILPIHFAAQYVSAAVEAIIHSSSAVVKISALKALNNYNKHLDRKHIAPYQRTILQNVAPMIEMTTEKTLSLILRTLAATTRIDKQIAAEYESVLGPIVLDTWIKFSAEILVSSDVVDFFSVLARNKYMQPALSARAMPVLVNMISSENPDKQLVSSAIYLLNSLIQGAATPLPQNYVAQFFPNLMSVLLTTDTNDDILQRGQECLILVLRKDIQQIINWYDDARGLTAMDLIIRFIAQLLHPSQTETASLFVGDLISALVKKGDNLFKAMLPELLRTVTARLIDAKLPSFIQPLILVFANLCLNQHEDVVDFLSGVTIHGRNGLEIVLTSWTTYHSDFQGQYQQKLSAVALAKLFMSNDPHVAAIQVRGNMIVTPSSRVKTRSKAKSTPDLYASVSVPVKIIKLLSADLTSKIEEEAASGAGDKEEEDSDFDDDDDEDDEESSFEEGDSTGGGNGSKIKKYKYAILSHMLGSLQLDMDGKECEVDGEDNDNDEDDPEVLADPIYQMSLKVYLVEFFRECIQQNSPTFAQSVAELSNAEKQALSTLLET
ncbi:hypothetical protein BG004_004876 [Podila humilis]|nr:hypothetical protein BG004_004876 [Podila humilis]